MSGDDLSVAPGAAAAAEAVARRSRGKLVALLCMRTRDLAAAEDALADAFAAALVSWPQQGVPANPEAWLLTAARRRRLIDGARASATHDGAADTLRLLALMFACAHPAIAKLCARR